MHLIKNIVFNYLVLLGYEPGGTRKKWKWNQQQALND